MKAQNVMALALAIASLVLVFSRLSRVGRRPKDYPPGPPTLPILGNLHQIPLEKAHKQFEKWAQEYGPIYSLILGTQVLIVLSTDQAVKDVLDRRGAIYSSRMKSHLAGDIFSGGMKVLLMVSCHFISVRCYMTSINSILGDCGI